MDPTTRWKTSDSVWSTLPPWVVRKSSPVTFWLTDWRWRRKREMRFAVRLHSPVHIQQSGQYVRNRVGGVRGTHGSVNRGMRLTACKGTPAICTCTCS